MSNAQTVVTRKGQSTIPKKYRDLLNLEEGSKIEWKLEDGRLYVQPVESVVARTFGSLRKFAAERNRGKSIEQILAEEKAAIEAGWLDRYERWERER